MATTDSQTRPYLGVGWKFPLQVTPRGRIAMARYEERVEESIYQILATARGERVMLPEFGCGIHEMVFAPNSAATLARVKQDVLQSLVRYERRIDVLAVEVENPPEEQNLLLIRVSYRIRANNAVGNVVYPFYVTESR
ncbi:MAG TPA: GPW/gp25 family protein [Longimicrobiaceae bacterium]|nr:GPW/gp25 family protein [Longimicrobiaceae bacterium]